MAEALLFETSQETLAKFTEFYRGKKAEKKENAAQLPLDERLANYILEGTKEGLIDDLNQAIARGDAPLEIINGPLMDGMSEVGRLFNDNQLIVAEVLQSAEAMKAAVSHLEPLMENSEERAKKGKMILATVKGDVHDIGKNLVDIILSNNGYEVIDLGIKVGPQQIIEEVRKHKPTFIGLSGLLVKSAQQMVLTAQDLKQAGIDTPILVGGAALSRKFTDFKISPEYEGPVLYSKDAMDGLAVANALHDSNKKVDFLEENKRETRKSDSKCSYCCNYGKTRAETSCSTSHSDAPVKIPSDVNRHVLKNYDYDTVQPYINRQMLIGHHLGLKGKVAEMLKEGNEKAIALNNLVDELIEFVKNDEEYGINAVYQFFPAQSEGNKVFIYNPENHEEVLEEFDFPRQTSAVHIYV